MTEIVNASAENVPTMNGATELKGALHHAACISEHLGTCGTSSRDQHVD